MYVISTMKIFGAMKFDVKNKKYIYVASKDMYARITETSIKTP